MGDMTTDADYVLCGMLIICFFGPLILAAVLMFR